MRKGLLIWGAWLVTTFNFPKHSQHVDSWGTTQTGRDARSLHVTHVTEAVGKPVVERLRHPQHVGHPVGAADGTPDGDHHRLGVVVQCHDVREDPKRLHMIQFYG